MSKSANELYSLGDVIPPESVQRQQLRQDDVLDRTFVCTDIELLRSNFGRQAVLTLKSSQDGQEMELTVWSRPLLRQLNEVNRAGNLPMLIKFGRVEGQLVAVPAQS